MSNFSYKNITVKTKALTLSLGTLLLALTCQAQISAADRKKLQVKEDSLKTYAMHMVLDSLTADRMKADSMFTRILVRTLQTRNSFYYPFDSVLGISKLYAPDTSFRIFTWNIQFDDYYGRQKGAIQLRTADGSLKLIPLRDFSEFTSAPTDSVRDKSNWIGAVYYNIIRNDFKGKKYYTLFGFDENTAQSSMKWIDVLTFNERNEPVFGGPFFTYDKDSIPKPPAYRFNIEFKKGARILVNYIEDLQMILVDHLVSESDEPDHAWTYVPDGDNEGYKWENGKWVHIDKVFTLKLKDGEAPVGDPLLDPKGVLNEEKLRQQSEKNKGVKTKTKDDQY